MANRLLPTGQGNALLTACQDQRLPRKNSRHAKPRGGQGMKSRLLVTGQGDAFLMAFQNMGCSRQGKPIACHSARQCNAHGMPRPKMTEANLKACQN
ncbi:hypothetical protein RHGRI_001434 [Rhododendron griersonianum]|uniref:Uncharacterized protein n=1 Tax=Rhododendron griersonianum TaxID=479676 RepID=A0AAV6LL87_9ERIC|nr:hypothetical protein RHGRI_001434 [Rhododendron griersonianum]